VGLINKGYLRERGIEKRGGNENKTKGLHKA
jgi:hypothetical protein